MPVCACPATRAGNPTRVLTPGLPDLRPTQSLQTIGFVNVHYFPAGASRFGTEVQGGYEFAGKTYVGYFEHVQGYPSCTDCHDAHELEVKTDNCFTCHAGWMMSKISANPRWILMVMVTQQKAFTAKLTTLRTRSMLPCRLTQPALLVWMASSMMPAPIPTSLPTQVRDFATWTPNLLGSRLQLPVFVQRIRADLPTTVSTSFSC